MQWKIPKQVNCMAEEKKNELLGDLKEQHQEVHYKKQLHSVPTCETLQSAPLHLLGWSGSVSVWPLNAWTLLHFPLRQKGKGTWSINLFASSTILQVTKPWYDRKHIWELGLLSYFLSFVIINSLWLYCAIYSTNRAVGLVMPNCCNDCKHQTTQLCTCSKC